MILNQFQISSYRFSFGNFCEDSVILFNFFLTLKKESKRCGCQINIADFVGEFFSGISKIF